MIGHFNAVGTPLSRRFRFSLRSMLILTTMTCLVLVLALVFIPPHSPLEGPVLILGPITSGSQLVFLDPPTDNEVIESLNRLLEDDNKLTTEGGQTCRIVREKTGEYVDPVRIYPLIGSARQLHAIYRCTIYFGPGPFDRYVFDIDHNHLHMGSDSAASPGLASDNQRVGADRP